MKSVVAIVLCGLMTSQLPPIGGVDSTFDKKANFAALRTYSWLPGTRAFNPKVHEIIVAALDAEMTALGFTKAETNADVTLAYYAMMVTNVDLKALDKIEREGKSAPAPTQQLGKLIVIMRAAKGGPQLWSASTREYLDPDMGKLEGTVRAVTARLFATYPGTRSRPAAGQ